MDHLVNAVLHGATMKLGLVVDHVEQSKGLKGPGNLKIRRHWAVSDDAVFLFSCITNNLEEKHPLACWNHTGLSLHISLPFKITKDNVSRSCWVIRIVQDVEVSIHSQVPSDPLLCKTTHHQVCA